MAITNKINTQYNYELIDRDFIIYEITTDDSKIKYGSYALDKLISEDKALSVLFEHPKTAYVLFKNNQNINKTNLIKDDPKLKIKKVRSSDIDEKNVLLNLFLYSLSNYENNEDAFNNVTGKLFIINPKFGKSKDSFTALSLRFDKEMVLWVEATTFTKLKVFKNVSKKEKGKIDEAPRYIKEENGKLKRVFNFKYNEDVYINRAGFNKKANIPFLLINNSKSAYTKTSYINKVLNELKEKYNDYFKFNFDEMKIERKISGKKDKKIEIKAIEFAKSKSIGIINKVEEKDYKEDYLEIVHFFNEYLKDDGYKPNISKKVEPDGLNLFFIHNKEHYKLKNGKYSDKDPHNSLPKDIVSQCITLEDSSQDILKGSRPLLITLFKELMIKNDIIKNKRITIDNWENYNFSNNWIFGIKKEFKDKETDQKYHKKFVIVIHPDGTFEFEEVDNLDKNKESKEIKELLEKINKSTNIEYFVQDDKGNLNVINRTNMFCLPNPEIFTKSHLSRGKEDRNKYFEGIIDINLFEDNRYYSAGGIGNGMGRSIPNATHIYKVDVIEGNNIIPAILETMSVQFVKYGSYTVMPYPFKYLNEYIEINKDSDLTINNKE